MTRPTRDDTVEYSDFSAQTFLPEAARALSRAVRELGEVVLPTECVGCGAWDEVVCEQCLEKLLAKPRHFDPLAESSTAPGEGFPGFAVATYEGPMRRLVLAGKHDKRRNLRPYFSAAGLQAAVAVAPEFCPAAPYGEVFVVPAPSTTPGSPSLAASAFAEGIRSGMVKSGAARSCGILEILRMKSGAKKQAGLGYAERISNRHHQMELAGPDVHGELRGAKLVLVDDVTTTGSTLLEMARVLQGAGAKILASFVFASTHFSE